MIIIIQCLEQYLTQKMLNKCYPVFLLFYTFFWKSELTNQMSFKKFLEVKYFFFLELKYFWIDFHVVVYAKTYIYIFNLLN